MGDKAKKHTIPWAFTKKILSITDSDLTYDKDGTRCKGKQFDPYWQACDKGKNVSLKMNGNDIVMVTSTGNVKILYTRKIY